MRHLLLAAALLSGACAALPSADAPRLRVATWNVQNLFDERDDPGTDDPTPSAADVATKLERLGAVLREIDADVVLLQEVENAAILQRLVAGPLKGRGYAVHLVEGRDGRGIDVGLLARPRVVRYFSHAREGDPRHRTTWSRDLVEAHLEVGGGRLIVLGSHFKSRLGDGGHDRRRAQAARAREVADDLALRWPGALVLVAGDLNDEPRSWALAPILADGTWIDLGARLPPGDAWTWSGSAGRFQLDYVLLPRAQAGRAREVTLWSSPGVRPASDHRPVVVDVDLRR